jgi:hypothetical protein
MKTAAIASALALGLLSSPWALARSADDRKAEEHSQGQHKTIHGIIAGVAAVGETMVDYQQNRAVTAEADYLTIVSPSGHSEKQGEQAGRSAKHDKDVKQTANAERAAGVEGRYAGDSSQRPARVFVIQITPKTQICECSEGDKDKKKCDLSRLDIGDRVEVQFDPADTSATPSQTQDTRHGRHRVMRGQAVEITVLHDKTGEHQRSEKSEQR